MVFGSEELRARISPLFEDNFTSGSDLGAAISIWHRGESALELCGGFRDAHRERPWTNDTLVLFWSATKGLGSACLLHLLQDRQISVQRLVAEFWPEFAQNGKAQITIAQLLSHQAGLVAVDEQIDITDYDAVITALARQKPLWPPGTAHGYHARTFGFLIDELVRRIDSRPISKYWRQVFADPLGLDIWIGLPAEENHRVATIYAAKTSSIAPTTEFYRYLTTPGTIQRRTFTSPGGLQAVSAMNMPENRARDLVSLGGIGSAHGLGKFYALLANGGEMEGRRFFSTETMGWMTRTLADGKDLVFEIPTAFSAGFMKDSNQTTRRIFGPSLFAFGHPGAGGSHAFADPETNVAFAYVMNQMERQILPDEKSLRLVDAIYSP